MNNQVWTLVMNILMMISIWKHGRTRERKYIWYAVLCGILAILNATV